MKNTYYSLLGHFQKFPSRVRVVQKNPSSIRVAGTRWSLCMNGVSEKKRFGVKGTPGFDVFTVAMLAKKLLKYDV